MSKVIEGRDDNFEQEVLASEIPVLVDFYADWCGPCRRLAPVLETLSDKMAGTAKIVKVNVERQSDIADAYKIRSLPTIVIVKHGEVVYQHSGVLPLAELERQLNQA
ncbi:MAG: thioredoxin [Candidatus Obscuribacterales bacterium]|nr:thioredoxin [Cyanobacteria bacterium HKST-UBA01]MCB9467009.1 thioredoxin [Candidatus Obscuribacterales bacterium]